MMRCHLNQTFLRQYKSTIFLKNMMCVTNRAFPINLMKSYFDLLVDHLIYFIRKISTFFANYNFFQNAVFFIDVILHIDIYNFIMMKQKSKKVGNFSIKIDKVLGGGTFATTCVAYKQNNSKQKYACKMINKHQFKQVGYFVERVRDQYKALMTLHHPNIVQFIAVQQTENNLYLFFQYCQSNLAAYIKQHTFNPVHQDIQNFSQQLIAACHYYTTKGFLHRDIKPENILIHKNQIKLADFGMAIELGNIQKTATFAGTPQYMAPQILQQNGAKIKDIQKCDVWSLGVTLYQLCSGCLPFGLTEKDKSQNKVLIEIQKGQQQIIIKQHPLLEKLIRGMLIIDPEKRINFDQAFSLICKTQK